jgi:hypothetical protein
MKQMDRSAVWQAYRDAASEACSKGETIIAEAVLRRALKEAAELSELDEGILQDVHSLAGLHCVNRNYENAERLYRSVLELREKLLGPYHVDVRDSLEKLAVVLREANQPFEATVVAFRAYSIEGRRASA